MKIRKKAPRVAPRIKTQSQARQALRSTTSTFAMKTMARQVKRVAEEGARDLLTMQAAARAGELGDDHGLYMGPALYIVGAPGGIGLTGPQEHLGPHEDPMPADVPLGPIDLTTDVLGEPLEVYEELVKRALFVVAQKIAQAWNLSTEGHRFAHAD